MNRVTVLGGSGFLGSHVVDALLEAGKEVTVFDKEPVDYWGGGVEIIQGDLREVESLNMSMTGAEAVFNFAGLADLETAKTKAVETAEINVLGNAQALESARRNDVHKFIYASSVYVSSREGGFYRTSKRAAEDYVREFHSQWRLPYVIARYGSLYGPRSDDRNGLHRIVRQALETGSVSYVGSLDALREYIHVVDAAKLTVSLLRTEFANESITVTGMQSMRVKDLLEMLSEILGLGGQVHFESDPDSAHYVRTPYAVMSTPSRKVVPNSHVDLGEGLLQLISNIQSQMKHENHSI